MQAICQGCQKIIEIQDLAEPTVVNLTNMSMVIVEHTRRSLCPHCLCQVTAGICGVNNLSIMAVPIPAEADKPVIVAPNGQLPKFMRN